MKAFKICEKFQMSLEMSRWFLSGNWPCWSYLFALPASSVVCCGQFALKVTCSCVLCVCVFISYFYSAASAVAKEWQAVCHQQKKNNTAFYKSVYWQ